MSLAINEKKICGYLDEKHIAHKDLGYSYLVSAIKLLCKEKTPRCFKANDVYAAVAEEYHATTARVERAIRSSISRSITRSATTDSHITNKEFIARAVDVLAYGDQKTE